VRLALLLAVAVLAAAVSAPPAGAARLAPPGTGADRVALAPASGGRAVLAWLRFALTPAGRAALRATGRAQVKVIATAANVSGAARTARQAFDVGRRRP
jgi:hypothetical protein